MLRVPFNAAASRTTSTPVVLALLLVLLLATSGIHATDYDSTGVPNGDNQWNIGPPLFQAFNITPDDTIKFFWSNQLPHNIWRVPTGEQCDNAGGTELVATTTNGNFDYTPLDTEVDTNVFFVCTIHCMRRTIGIQAAVGPSTTPTITPTTTPSVSLAPTTGPSIPVTTVPSGSGNETTAPSVPGNETTVPTTAPGDASATPTTPAPVPVPVTPAPTNGGTTQRPSGFFTESPTPAQSAAFLEGNAWVSWYTAATGAVVLVLL